MLLCYLILKLRLLHDATKLVVLNLWTPSHRLFEKRCPFSSNCYCQLAPPKSLCLLEQVIKQIITISEFPGNEVMELMAVCFLAHWLRCSCVTQEMLQFLEAVPGISHYSAAAKPQQWHHIALQFFRGNTRFCQAFRLSKRRSDHHVLMSLQSARDGWRRLIRHKTGSACPPAAYMYLLTRFPSHWV